MQAMQGHSRRAVMERRSTLHRAGSEPPVQAAELRDGEEASLGEDAFSVRRSTTTGAVVSRLLAATQQEPTSARLKSSSHSSTMLQLAATATVLSVPQAPQPPTRRRPGSLMKRGVRKVMVISKFVNAVGNSLVEHELQAHPLFAACSPAFIAKTSAIAHTRNFKNGEAACTAGDTGSSLFLVQVGSLDVMVNGVCVGTLRKEQTFGETYFLGLEDKFRATLQARLFATVSEITRSELLEVLDDFPMERTLFEDVARRGRQCEGFGELAGPIASLFLGLPQALLAELDRFTLRRLYFPNDRILEEGASNEELHVLMHGRTTIEVAGRWVRDESSAATAPAASRSSVGTFSTRRLSRERHVYFGELGLLGLSDVQTCTVIAQTVCYSRVIHREVLMKLLEGHGESLESMVGLPPGEDLRGFKTGEQLRHTGVFGRAACSDGFLDFVAQHLEERLFLKGQPIVSGSDSDKRSIYILRQGHADGLDKSITCGAIFGEIAAFGLAGEQGCSSIVAGSCCVCQVLHQGVVVRGLEVFHGDQESLIAAHMQLRRASPDAGFAISPDKRQAGLWPREAIIAMLQAVPPFSDMNPGTIEELSAGATDRVFMPGDLIIREGRSGDSMFIMLSGTAGVYVSDTKAKGRRTSLNLKEGMGLDVNSQDLRPLLEEGGPDVHAEQPHAGELEKSTCVRVGTLAPGGVCGELAMLGVSLTRSASIEAEQICLVWECTQEKMLPILERNPLSKQRFQNLIIEHLERTVPGRMLSLPLLQGFDRKFRTLLSLYCERRVYFPGQLIAREGAVGERLFVINMGRATFESKGETIKVLTPGSHFGAGTMLQVTKVYIGTLVALQTCHVLAITHTAYTQTLERYPSSAAAKQLRRQELAFSEELSEVVRKTCTRKQIWRRYNTFFAGIGISGGDGEAPGQGNDSQVSCRRMFEAWRKQARSQAESRRWHACEQESRELTIQKWAAKQQAARERAAQRAEEEGSGSPTSARAGSAARALRTARTQRSISTADGGPASGEPEEQRLPKIGPAAELAKMRLEWPAPQPSPFYALNVWKVLSSSVAASERLVPLIVSACRESDGEAIAARLPAVAPVRPAGPPHACPRSSEASSRRPASEAHSPPSAPPGERPPCWRQAHPQT